MVRTKRLQRDVIILTIKQGANVDFGGRVRKIGLTWNISKHEREAKPILTLISVKQSVGAATLLLSVSMCCLGRKIQ